MALDDFIYATPNAPVVTVPDSGSTSVLLGLGLATLLAVKRRVFREVR